MASLRACPTCGLVHRLPAVPPAHAARCTRCRSEIHLRSHRRSLSRAGALAAAALTLYVPAMTAPVMTIERLGHESTASIWSGMVGLLAEGHVFVGLAVLLFSLVAPIAKLGAVVTLCLGDRALGQRQRAWVYRGVETIGKWGMVDVLLVAVLVALVKLGDVVEVQPGYGVVLFGCVVMLSLLASAAFDPHAIWESGESSQGDTQDG
ncbi:MAG: paraquat-inducible protein A [Planctomycetota bacterium]